MLGEFDLIRRYLSPLARGAPGALGLTDDAALLRLPAGRELVITADALVAGVHFLPDDPPARVARKLLRVNLSDLAAMGAEPLGYLVTAALPAEGAEAWVAGFAEGLAEDQRRYGIDLLGGDTTRGEERVVLSLTALGAAPEGRALKRSTAGAGDLIYVSGSIGDAALGLKARRGDLAGVGEAERAYLVERYELPHPRLALGAALLAEGLASAASDVSDGLVADLGHVAATSGLAARIEAARVPLSPAARAALGAEPALLATVLTGGDDYELIFTLPPERRAEAAGLAERLDLPLTEIGALGAGEGVAVVDDRGAPVALERGGWTHF